MMKINTVGLDLAERFYPSPRYRRRQRSSCAPQVKGARVLLFFSRLRPCLVGMEACVGAHF